MICSICKSKGHNKDNFAAPNVSSASNVVSEITAIVGIGGGDGSGRGRGGGTIGGRGRGSVGRSGGRATIGRGVTPPSTSHNSFVTSLRSCGNLAGSCDTTAEAPSQSSHTRATDNRLDEIPLQRPIGKLMIGI
ncbi:conserved hypothetical protein [Ricinus communis]|uniref:Uncharacterized protein n=1 Tax=Ricinus communis TaxID=3988 RepID=B9RX21_RICCO|nr:conserved hypothetical protein [Ricinus communis]